ncbi:hypothetical protein E4T56_gene17963, partial [Termitomyces sp. T112]
MLRATKSAHNVGGHEIKRYSSVRRLQRTVTVRDSSDTPNEENAKTPELYLLPESYYQGRMIDN